jgi:hypothetical protein
VGGILAWSIAARNKKAAAPGLALAACYFQFVQNNARSAFQGKRPSRDVGSLADWLQAATNPKFAQFYCAAERDTSKVCQLPFFSAK